MLVQFNALICVFHTKCTGRTLSKKICTRMLSMRDIFKCRRNKWHRQCASKSSFCEQHERGGWRSCSVHLHLTEFHFRLWSSVFDVMKMNTDLSGEERSSSSGSTFKKKTVFCFQKSRSHNMTTWTTTDMETWKLQIVFHYIWIFLCFAVCRNREEWFRLA
jgi:hypothetical protein